MMGTQSRTGREYTSSDQCLVAGQLDRLVRRVEVVTPDDENRVDCSSGDFLRPIAEDESTDRRSALPDHDEVEAEIDSGAIDLDDPLADD